MINEGQFETVAKTSVLNKQLEKELEKYGLTNNGGDTIYSSRNKATMVSWGMEKKIIDYLKSKGKFTMPVRKGNEYFLEYNLRTKKFEIVRLFNEVNGEMKWYNPVVINVEDDTLFKRIAEIAKQQKKVEDTKINYKAGEYHAAAKYAVNHLVKEEASYFPY